MRTETGGGFSRVRVDRVAVRRGRVARGGGGRGQAAAARLVCRGPKRAAGPGRRAGEGQAGGGVDGGRGRRIAPLIYKDTFGEAKWDTFGENLTMGTFVRGKTAHHILVCNCYRERDFVVPPRALKSTA